MQIARISPRILPSFRQTKAPVVAISNEAAIDTLQKKLSETMTESEIQKWTKNILSICEKLKIEPKQLPISPELPGNLTPEQNSQIYEEVLLDIRG